MAMAWAEACTGSTLAAGLMTGLRLTSGLLLMARPLLSMALNTAIGGPDSHWRPCLPPCENSRTSHGPLPSVPHFPKNANHKPIHCEAALSPPHHPSRTCRWALKERRGLGVAALAVASGLVPGLGVGLGLATAPDFDPKQGIWGMAVSVNLIAG